MYDYTLILITITDVTYVDSDKILQLCLAIQSSMFLFKVAPWEKIAQVRLCSEEIKQYCLLLIRTCKDWDYVSVYYNVYFNI